MLSWQLTNAVTALLIPPGLLILALAGGLAVLHRYPRTGRTLLISASAGLYLLAMPLTATYLLQQQEAVPLDVTQLENAQAIVVLGGGIAPAAPPHTTEPELTDASDRIWQAARMFKAGTAPKIIVSGGSFVEQQGGPATTEAEAMRRFLLDLGVPGDAIVSEGKALNTIENIRNVRELVKGGRVAIVTSAFHVPRAAWLARQAGLDFAIFGVDWSVPSDAVAWWDAWLPSAGALGESNTAIKELVALTFDRRGDVLAP